MYAGKLWNIIIIITQVQCCTTYGYTDKPDDDNEVGSIQAFSDSWLIPTH